MATIETTREQGFVGSVRRADPTQQAFLILRSAFILAPLVAAWLTGIVINLLTFDPPRFYDIALRDVGLLLGAVALARLATHARERRPRR